MEAMSTQPLDWSVASRNRAGEKESGDRCIVVTQPAGALLAVADGLGHGAEAARAADIAVRTVERFATDPLAEIVRHCHETLQRSRGVALSLARWDAQGRILSWVGVGNVEGVLLHGDGGSQRPVSHRLMLRGGVVGVRLPTLQVSPLTVPGQALLILATDGIAGAFEQGVGLLEKTKSLADQIVARHGRDTDDATVLIARLEG